jgi:hypothetical protein
MDAEIRDPARLPRSPTRHATIGESTVQIAGRRLHYARRGLCCSSIPTPTWTTRDSIPIACRWFSMRSTKVYTGS